MSLGHTIRASGPSASAVATATTMGSSPASTGGTSGRRSTDTSSAWPGAASQARPLRPRPALWRSAPITSPSPAPARAWARTSSLVEPVSGDHSTGPATGGRRRGVTSIGTTGSASSASR